MNWFQRHLNWTVVLAAVAGYAIAVGAGFTIESLNPSAPDEAFLGIFFIPLAILLPVAGWALKQKGRSLGWLGIFFVPFGWIFFLCLENRRRLAEPIESPEEELPSWGISTTEGKSGIESEGDADSQIDDTLKARHKGRKDQKTEKPARQFCENCGVKLSEELTYCPNCGKKLRD